MLCRRVFYLHCRLVREGLVPCLDVVQSPIAGQVTCLQEDLLEELL